MRELFEETIERVLSDLVTPELIAEAERGAWPDLLWQAIIDTGLGPAAAPEALGGVGGSWHDSFALIRAAGRHAAPLPLAETIAVNWLLGLAGLNAAQGAASLGTGTGTLSNGHYSGSVADVPWGGSVDDVLVVASGSAPELVLLPRANAQVSQAWNVAREPRDLLIFSDAAPVARAPLPAGSSSEIIAQTGAMIRAAQIAGGLARLLHVATDYANQRVQFGRPIGKFQAIQHQLALLAEQTALASAAAEMAFALSAAGPAPFAIAGAKSVASEAAGQGAAIAHAVLGAIGFTYEHSLHFTTRRLWSWRAEFGSQTYWAQSLGQAMCGAGGTGFWPALTGAMAIDAQETT